MSRVRKVSGWVARVTVAAALGVPLAAGTGQTAAHASAPGVTPEARTLIQRVRQASIAEIWAGERAQQQSSDSAVRWVGQNLLIDHVYLDQQAERAADELGIDLPREPTLQQQAAIRKMARETGEPFDRAFANTLYYGHDRVMELIREVQRQARRPGTPATVRRFADMAARFVAKHMEWLAATGLVTTASTRSAAAQADAAREASGAPDYSNGLALAIGLALLAAMAFATARRLLGPHAAA